MLIYVNNNNNDNNNYNDDILDEKQTKNKLVFIEMRDF
jgi:hypothetical protein